MNIILEKLIELGVLGVILGAILGISGKFWISKVLEKEKNKNEKEMEGIRNNHILELEKEKKDLNLNKLIFHEKEGDKSIITFYNQKINQDIEAHRFKML